MRKRFLSIFLCLCMCLTPAFALSDQSESVPINTLPTTAAVNEIIAAEQPLVDAYQNMLETFVNDNGVVEYPATYAGAFIEDGVLHINIIEGSTPTYVLQRNETDKISIHEVPYSYNALQELSSEIVSLNIPNVTSVGVSDRDNEVHIGINKNTFSNSKSEEAFLNSIEDKVKSAIRLKCATDNKIVPYEDFPIECYLEEPASVSATTLQGGIPITNADNGYGFSLAICGTYYGNDPSGEDAILTCGHDMSVGDTIKVSGTTLGEIQSRMFTAGERYDYGIATISNSSAFTSTNRVLNNSNYTTITDIARSNPVGTTVCKYGRNGFANAVIIYSDRSVNYNNIGYIHGLVHCTVESAYVGYCGGGDSGGSIYRGHDFHGIYSGDNRSPITATNATKFYYTPVYGVPNFSVRTS